MDTDWHTHTHTCNVMVDLWAAACLLTSCQAGKDQPRMQCHLPCPQPATPDQVVEWEDRVGTTERAFMAGPSLPLDWFTLKFSEAYLVVHSFSHVIIHKPLTQRFIPAGKWTGSLLPLYNHYAPPFSQLTNVCPLLYSVFASMLDT